ncbi:MAG: hypothetical protein NTV66_04715 [Methylococcales bacterium]|jgi:hypothetical protein|nr:hypothetical protein [Methylococcales bacterium]
MGPYYRNTSQGMGGFVEVFYEHPSLMVLFVAATIGVGVYLWRKKKTE